MNQHYEPEVATEDDNRFQADAMATLYCPKCGEPLQTNSQRELACLPGEMGLSPVLERRLRECYVTNEREPTVKPLGFEVGGSWFCPGCGCVIPETSPGNLQCPTCGKQLAEFIYSLVELHPHKGPL